MNPQSSTTSNSLIDPQIPMQPVIAVTTEGRGTPIAADRMYQIAALTAGFFLLATLL
jgi:hypothetical protein